MHVQVPNGSGEGFQVMLPSMQSGFSSGARIAAALGLAVTLSLSGCMAQGTDGADAGDDTSVETVAPKEDGAPEEDGGPEAVTEGAGYEHQDVEGLTADELVDELYPSASLSEALQDDPMEVGEEIQLWFIKEGGYNHDAQAHEGRADAGFDVGGIVVTVEDDCFAIRLLLYNNPTFYEYRSTVIPTADEARQLALDNISQ